MKAIRIRILSVLVLGLALAGCGTTSVANTPVPTAQATAAPTGTAVGTPSPVADSSGDPQGPAGQSTPIPMPIGALDPNLKAGITVWASVDYRLAGTLNTQLQRFKKLYPGVAVNVYTLDGTELHDRMLALKNGTGTATKVLPPPDIIMASADETGAWADAGAIQPVSPLLDSAYIAGFDPNALSGANYKNQLWGTPISFGHTLALYYNKQLVPTPPATTDDMLKTALAIRNGRKNGGLLFDANEPFWLVPWLTGYGGALVDATGQPTLDSPAMVQALTFIQSLTDKQHIVPYTSTQQNAVKNFIDGKLGMYIEGDWGLVQMQARLAQLEKKSADKPKDAQGNDVMYGYTNQNTAIAPLPKVTATGQYAAPYFDNPTLFLGTHLQANTDALKATKLLLSYFAAPQEQSEIAAQVRLVPATTAVLNSATVQQDPLLSGLAAQLKLAHPQPVNAQMPAVWSAIRPSLAQVVAGTLAPAAAATAMQSAATAALQAK